MPTVRTSRARRRGAGAAAWTALLALACATAASDRDVEADLRRAAASVRGLRGDVRVFVINADSRMAAWTLAAEAREPGNLPISRQLARRMEVAAKHRDLLAVGGPYPRLTRGVCLDALRVDPKRKLAGLTLVYVGSADSAGDVREAARARGVRFVQRELP
jgi:hypothetical protein